MADLVQSIGSDGSVIKDTTALDSLKTAQNSLGKDAFLQLLVCQMQNQDPLNPSSDTEYISQLATFSQLEELQNLSSTMTSMQAMSLVGKYVTVSATDSTGATKEKGGIIDSVSVKEGKSYINIGAEQYPAENITGVYGEDFSA